MCCHVSLSYHTKKNQWKATTSSSSSLPLETLNIMVATSLDASRSVLPSTCILHAVNLCPATTINAHETTTLKEKIVSQLKRLTNHAILTLRRYQIHSKRNASTIVVSFHRAWRPCGCHHRQFAPPLQQASTVTDHENATQNVSSTISECQQATPYHHWRRP